MSIGMLAWCLQPDATSKSGLQSCDGAHLKEKRLQHSHLRPGAAGSTPGPFTPHVADTAVNALAVSPVNGRLYAGLSTGTIRVLDSECVFLAWA